MLSREFKDRIVTMSPRIYPMVCRMLSSEEDAQDAIQEIMLKLWKKRKFLKEHPNLAGYVFVTARNHCLDQLKSKRSMIDILTEDEISMYIKDEQGGYEGVEMYNIIKEIVSDLPDKQQQVLIYRDIDGLKFEEIVALTGEKIENIRVHLSRARKRIGTKLTEIYSYESGTGR
jgi:RNA polymerase sigma factor (sigma-70 family)